MFAVAGLVDPDIHATVANAILAQETNIMKIVDCLQTDSYELSANVFAAINSLVIAEGHTFEARTKLKEKFLSTDVPEVAKKLRAKGGLPPMLEVQLQIFEDGIGEGGFRLADRGIATENPEKLFNKLRESVKGTPVYDIFVALMQHLLVVRRNGKAGYPCSS